MEKLVAEKKLLGDIKKGDRQAMQTLYSCYAGSAMAVALRYVSNRADAEDIVQDSFVKVFTTISRFEYRGEGSIKGWMMRIVANEAISFLKRKDRITYTDDIPYEPDTGEPEVEQVPPDMLTRLIGELPNGYRLVLNLYVFGQLSHKEIALKLGITENTSASQYLRAKKLLAKKIKDFINSKENG